MVSACAPATSPPPLPPRRVAVAPGPAHVQQRAPRPPDIARATEPPVVHERYLGWILVADLASLVPLVRWMGRPEDVYLAAPAAVLSPVIHVLHGEGAKAALSLTLRGAMLGAVYLAGRSAEEECDDPDTYICVPIGSFMLANVAIVSVMLIDSLFLARRAREVDGWRRLPVLPSVSATPDGGGVMSLGGRF